MNSDVSSGGRIDPIAAFRAFELFADVDPGQLDKWIARIEFLELADGEKLFEQGETADSLYIVVQGLLEVCVTQEQCGRVVVGHRGPGSLLGEIALLTGGKRNASVFAKKKSTLAKLRSSVVRDLLAQYPEMKRRFLEIARDRLRLNQWLNIMKRYFGEIDEAALKFIEPHLDWVHIERGRFLFTKGENDDSLYFLVHGLLRVVDADSGGREIVIETVHRGEIVGEMSLLTGEARAASTRAIRDSDLVRLSSASFREISEKYRLVSLAIARVLVERLKHRGQISAWRGAASVAVIPAGPEVPLQEFSKRLHAEMCRLEPTTLLSSRTIDQEFCGQTIAQTAQSDPRNLELVAWLEDLEARTSFILYEADTAGSAWTRRCVERADQILLVGVSEDDPSPSAWERECLSGNRGDTAVRTDLILVHRDGGRPPARTSAWLKERRLSSYQHVRWGNEADFARLARIVSRRSVGVVLGGGGAKGIAHIGVLRALAEAGIPIDMIGGSSMGSVVAGLHALGRDPAQMIAAFKEILRKQSPLTVITLPLVSLVRGRTVDSFFRSLYGDVLIEDLWTSYFCTTSNLHSCELKVHREGPLWRAIRTSCSVPGILAPVPYDGEVHVDGGVLNNLPCDVMRQDAGFVIAVDVDTCSAMTVDFQEFPAAGKVLRDRILRRKQAGQTPNIFSIMHSAFRASNRVHVAKVKPEADLCIEPPIFGVGMLGFSRLETVLQIGYDCAKKTLACLPEDSPLRKVRGPCP